MVVESYSEASHECHGVSNHQQLDSLFRLTNIKGNIKSQSPESLALCEGNSSVTHKGWIMQKSFLFHEVIMSHVYGGGPVLQHKSNSNHKQIYQPLMCGDRVISVYLGHYHGCWCPGSLRRQDISSHDIDYVVEAGPCLTRGGISTTCVLLVWRNDVKC